MCTHSCQPVSSYYTHSPLSWCPCIEHNNPRLDLFGGECECKVKASATDHRASLLDGNTHKTDLPTGILSRLKSKWSLHYQILLFDRGATGDSFLTWVLMIFSLLLCHFVLFPSCFQGKFLIILPPADWGHPEHFCSLLHSQMQRKFGLWYQANITGLCYYCQVSRSNLQTVAVVKGHRRLWPLKHSFFFFNKVSSGF